MSLNKQLLKTTVLFLVLIETLSLIGFVYPQFNPIMFFAILAGVLIVSLKKLEYGLYAVLSELVIGSFGRLFEYDTGGFSISIRMGLFIIIMAVWFGKSVNPVGFREVLNFFSTKIGKWYIGLGLVVVFGFINGIIRNDFADVFFDFNNWLYYLYIIPFYTTFAGDELARRVGSSGEGGNLRIKKQNKENKVKIANLLTVMTASLIVLFFQTIALEWFFAHKIPGTIETLYRWVRDYRIGEITFFSDNFYRVFIQSQVWALFGFFIILGTRFFRSSGFDGKIDKGFEFSISNVKTKIKPETISVALLFMLSVILIISFSRSLWVGWIAGFGLFFVSVWRVFGVKFFRAVLLVLKQSAIVIVAGIFIVIIINVPSDKPGADFGEVVSNRLTGIEAAGSSRINLLNPLWRKALENPIIGKGFGATVTYASVDPRILATTAGASGEYTTYAFEWAYLDMWLKFGLIGLFVYVGLLFELLRNAWMRSKERDSESGIYFGFLMAIISLLAVNVFTPYLNHPLGIGFVILATVIVTRRNKQNIKKTINAKVESDKDRSRIVTGKLEV